MRTNTMHRLPADNGQNQPWYKQFWPWFIIALPATVVVASFFTLWLAVTNPDQLVLTDQEYHDLKKELKAEVSTTEHKKEESDSTPPSSR